MSLDLIFVRYPHWFSATMQVRAYLRSRGRDARLVLPGRFASFLEALGDVRGPDFLVTTDLPVLLSSVGADKEIRCILHHNAAGIAEFERHFAGALASAGRADVSIAFYADGYTNRFLDTDHISEWLASPGAPGLCETLLFDFDLARLPAHLENTALVIGSQYISDFATRPLSVDLLQEACGQISRDAKHPDVLILLMRPLGSMTFHRGAFAIENGAEKVSELISGLLRRVEDYLGRRVSTFLRLDARDISHSQSIVRQLAEIERAGDVGILAPQWPEWLTFEPFLFGAASRLDPIRLHVGAFDSTGTLPFLQLGTVTSHFFGLPAVPDETNTGMTAFKRKVDFLRTRIIDLDLTKMRVNDLDDGFWHAQID